MNQRLFLSTLLVCLVRLPLQAEEPVPRFSAMLVCYNGQLDSGSKCSSTLAKDEGGLSVHKGTSTCGFPGAVSEITWRFLGQKDGKDLYHFSRKFPSDAAKSATTEADVAFDGGQRQIIFQDKAQSITIEPRRRGEP